MLRVWNAILVAGAFALSLFGTFLTRSGILSSIHCFTQSSIGPWFLGFITLVARRLDRADPLAPAAPALAHAARVARLARGRVPLQQPLPRRLRADDPLGRPLPDHLGGRARRDGHRRGAVLRLLRDRVRAADRPADGPRPADRLAACVASRPRRRRRLAGRRRARDGRSSSWRSARGRARPASSATPSPPSSSPRSCTSSRGARARARRYGASTWLGAFTSLVGRNRRRYGGYVVHASIVLLMIGAIGIGGFSSSREASLAPGESVTVAGYTLTLLGTDQRRAANAQELRARLAVERDGERDRDDLARARTATSPSSRRRTRSRSAPTRCEGKTCS